MKQVIIAALLATAVLAERDYEAMFKQFKSTHLKAYKDEAEETKRFGIFVENMKKAELLQAANPLAIFGANAYADVSATEFKSRHNAERHYRVAASKAAAQIVKPTLAEIKAAAGEKIDWRQKGAVTPVKDQGECGSCWAFSTTGGIEGQWFLAGNTLTSLSEQVLVSCDTIDSGCNGGLMDNAFEWLLKNRTGAIASNAALPYDASTYFGFATACPANYASLATGATIDSYNDITKTEDAMAAYCFAKGPVSIAVDASSWQFYTSGIMTNCISQAIDHGVLIVGFDDTNVPPYWIIKNSWAATWGEQGYIRVAKGSNQCLITEYPTSSIVNKKSVAHTVKKVNKKAAPVSATTSGTFTQSICTNGACNAGCTSETFPQNTCVALQSGGSAFITCTKQEVDMRVYTNSSSCVGDFSMDVMPTDQCLNVYGNEYVLNTCAK